MQPMAEMHVPITLADGVERTMRFNANSMIAYEEATGEFFLEAVASLYDVMQPVIAKHRKAKEAKASDAELATLSFDILRLVSIKKLRALLWSTLHEYDKQDEPHWPLTIGQVGRLLQPKDVNRVFTAFLQGQAGNSPTKEEMGESPAPAPTGSLKASAVEPTTDPDGGERSIELPADAFV